MDPDGEGDGEELGGLELGEIIVRIYCVRKNKPSILNKSKNEKEKITKRKKSKAPKEPTSLTSRKNRKRSRVRDSNYCATRPASSEACL